ncbi:MAG: hypothetical protein IH623_18960 [Verrucomicrobia bacterium]|nr:hypothetical protein [Verrucomicrobiota bacterium]
MKTPISLLFVLLAGGVAAQTPQEQQNLDRNTATSKVPRVIESRSVETNRVTGRSYSVSGIAVQVVKTRRVLQLLNPVAPPRYFAGNANTVRDPKSGRVEGLKLMSLEF